MELIQESDMFPQCFTACQPFISALHQRRLQTENHDKVYHSITQFSCILILFIST